MTVNKLEPDNGTPNDELFTVAGMFDGSLYKLLLRMAFADVCRYVNAGDLCHRRYFLAEPH